MPGGHSNLGDNVDFFCKQPVDIVRDILKAIEELGQFRDVDTILDRVLLEARKISAADAGSIFLIRDGQLHFSYVHNDTLFRQSEASRHIYANLTVPVSETSIVGYAALTGQTLVIEDAYHLDPALPYSFNRSFDEESGYRTRSILAIPLTTLRGTRVGVMQLINATCNGQTTTFSGEAVQYAPFFAAHASVAIERGIMTRELILRMMKMAEMRDPSETGAHVQRVGAYAAEIYQHMAETRGEDGLEIKRKKDLIRLAAMLHDVGKVAISDLILKKPARLTEEEFATMRWHTVYGAALFANSTSDLDDLCADIALNHHERWDGGGYPGHLEKDLGKVTGICARPRRGEEIPLPARITALADVFDALCSRRAYKEPWSEADVLDEIRSERGRHFDPAVVDAFFATFDVIRAIREKYRDEP